MARPERPCISVILPTLPTAQRIRPLIRALRCVAHQSLPAHEVLLIQDGPTPDDWSRGLAQAGVLGPKVRRVPLPQRVGHVRARRVGIRLARSRYVAFLDDDDLWLPHHLADLWQALRRPGVVLAYTDAEVVTLAQRATAHPVVVERLPFAFDWDPAFLEHYNFVIPSSILYDRRVHRLIGALRPAAGHHWDWDFLLRVAARGLGVVRVPRASVLYTVDTAGTSESSRLTDMALSAARLTQAHRLAPVPGHNFRTMLDEADVQARLQPTTLLWDGTVLPGETDDPGSDSASLPSP